MKNLFSKSCLALVLFSVSSCSIHSPNSVEQAELVRKGTFVQGTPMWLTNAGNGGALPEGNIGGIVTRPSPLLQSREAAALANWRQSEVENENRRLARLEAANKAIVPNPQDLAKQEYENQRKCSAFTPVVERTLQQGTPVARTAALEELVSKCPSSLPFWLQLGKAYQENRDFVSAARAYQKVLDLDFRHAEAQKLLREVQVSQLSIGKDKSAALVGGVQQPKIEAAVEDSIELPTSNVTIPTAKKVAPAMPSK